MKSNEAKVVSINLADELVILLYLLIISILLTQSQWERCRMRTRWETQTLREQGLYQQFSKSNNSCV